MRERERGCKRKRELKWERERVSEGKFERFYLRLRVWGGGCRVCNSIVKENRSVLEIVKMDHREASKQCHHWKMRVRIPPPPPSTLLLRRKEDTIMYAKNWPTHDPENIIVRDKMTVEFLEIQLLLCLFWINRTDLLVRLKSNRRSDEQSYFPLTKYYISECSL